MDRTCGICGGELVSGRLMTGAHLVGFTPLGEEKKFRPKYVHVVCDACRRCGSITNLRAERPEALE